MTSPQGNPARREPLLWLQLLGLAALPLEVAALLLVLAGADPGPLPGLERVFAWALGALGPAALFWKLPPDLWSLLLLQVPLRGRRPDQLRLSALQTALPLKLLAAAGAPLLLPLLWWADGAAGLAWSISPFTTTPRALVLLLAAVLLAVMLWQWQQILQALWMFSRPASQLTQTLPLSSSDAAERRLNIGLPLLLLAPLEVATPPDTATAAAMPAEAPKPEAVPQAEPKAELEQNAEAQAVPEPEPEPEQEPEHRQEPDQGSDQPDQPAPSEGSETVALIEEPGEEPAAEDSPSIAADSTAITPEEGSEEGQGSDLDQKV